MTRFIAIDGKGGAGKTYLAELLADILKAELFHLDAYGNDFEPFVGISALIDALSKTESSVVIYEGVGVFDERFDQFAPYRILVSVPDEVRKVRAEGRDVPTIERSSEEWATIYDIWKDAEEGYFTDAVKEKADLIVGEKDGAFDVEEIVAMIHNQGKSL